MKKWTDDGRRTDDGGFPYYKLPRGLRLRGAKILGVKLIKGRSYYLIQQENKEPEFQSASMENWDASGFITYLMDLNRQAVQEDRIQAIMDKHNSKAPPFDPLKMVMMD